VPGKVEMDVVFEEEGLPLPDEDLMVAVRAVGVDRVMAYDDEIRGGAGLFELSCEPG